MTRFRTPEVEFVEGVRCVVMPCCGFTFDAGHSDDQPGEVTWSCPLCSPTPVPETEHENA